MLGRGRGRARRRLAVEVEAAQRRAQQVVEVVRRREGVEEGAEARGVGFAARAQGGGGVRVLLEVRCVGGARGGEPGAEGAGEGGGRGVLEVGGAAAADGGEGVERREVRPGVRPASGDGLFDEGAEDVEFAEVGGLGHAEL